MPIAKNLTRTATDFIQSAQQQQQQQQQQWQWQLHGAQYREWGAGAPRRFVFGTIRIIITVICITIILWKQICYEKHFLSTVNTFLKLFAKLQTLQNQRNLGFGGEFELFLLLSLTLIVIYGTFSDVVYFLEKVNKFKNVFLISTIFMNFACRSMLHICFIGYLSVNVLYTEFNNYVRHEFTEQMRSLERFSRPDLVKAGKQLDECIALYEDIQSAATKFHRLVEVPLFALLSYTMYFITQPICKIILLPFLWKKTLIGFVMLQIINVVILSFAVDKAIVSSRVIRNLSFENEFIWQHRELIMNMEMFLGRLHLKQFRVQVLGLFDISNRFLLFCLSAIITHITIILQIKLGAVNKN
ncbi:uncharacterized protein Dwil_GK18289 [Drosophila willistoni]|uniref:Gustatory receptor n=1 Tax=Drosophila willistoni TaxID=7260 RepID=A0A0Q9WYM3_DROWI|nr:uncharacterized protein Dwil_GK18289 [Drosophila willistoni]